ncbi:MAG: cytidylyltransferase domain-containing protein [Roseateles asaccharophilus]|uniref:N-acylneuraminate cytidylyltransferase n=1 Tax=Roseateles asaccharophilus TaxID=582607 RepID=A0A4R6N2X3_9BURK|nr:acylneuraminate cytidylyltransferase family protein [Roseateles asaccharophilus]MDN3545724.1 acylneuraminate cytidylyltransferase family protein [Roseateles asaccharophilus]TDP07592.1 N-acylneuraminate cytidylyltransferase [Roseateles asaccharophilus]
MIDGLRVLAIIPARGGSKGIPDKNIAPLGGMPLIGWTVKAARASEHIDEVILSSDDDKIIDEARKLGCNAPFKRSPMLATDTSASIDVVMDALDRTPGYDIVVLLQPTSPLRTAADIDGCLRAMVNTAAPAAVTVRPAADHPYLVFSQDDQGRLSHFTRPPEGASLRRQDLPNAWCLNGAVYAARCDWLRASRSFLSPQTVGFHMPTDRSIDIDTPDDLARVRSLVPFAS